MNLRAKPTKEAFSLLDQYIEEKDKQCITHTETTKEIENEVKTIKEKVSNLKNGWITQLLNMAIGLTALLILIFKKGG